MAENALEVARRDRELSKIIELFQTTGPGDDVTFMGRMVDAANMLKAAADSRQIAQLDEGQIVSAFSAVRSAYSMLRLTDEQLLTSVQLTAGMRGIGGLIERWARPDGARFQQSAYDAEVDGLAEYFTQSLKNIQLLGRLYDGRIGLPSDQAVISRQRGAVALALITLPTNPFNKAV